MANAATYKQPWLHSWLTDAVFILSPPFVALLLVVCFPSQFQTANTIPVYYWLFLVVFIDVAHVYSTLYRTYFVSHAYKKSALLLTVPLACYLAGVLLHSYSGLLFWRVLAYLAIFHFVRQQYGFMKLYSRQEQSARWAKTIDTIAIYTASVYPLLYWHIKADRNFSWFIENDVIIYQNPMLLNGASVMYVFIIAVYAAKEVFTVIQVGKMNVPRNAIIAGTFISWYFGIVYFNGDMAFTTLNVISHGIPYMALIWVFEKKQFAKGDTKSTPIIRYTFSKYTGVLLFVGLMALLAYFEEGLWDGLIWKEHGSVFGAFSALPKIDSEQILSLLVPLLALPQSTHYVLDGFIWKIAKPDGSAPSKNVPVVDAS